MNQAPRYVRQHWSLAAALYRVVDALCIVGGMWLVGLWQPAGAVQPLPLFAALAVTVYLLVSELMGVYRSWRGAAAASELVCVVMTWVVSHIGLLAGSVLVSDVGPLDRGFAWAWFLVTPLLMIAARLFIRGTLRLLRARGVGACGYAIVGVTEIGIELARNIEQMPELGLQLIGFYDDRSEDRTVELPADVGSRIGTIGELVEQSRAGRVQRIYITLPMRAEQRIRQILDELSDSTATVYLVPDFFVYQLLHSRWVDLRGLPVVSVFDTPFYGVDGALKRAMDLVLASCLLVVLAIPMAVIAVLVKLSSPGPVFFRQRRYGLDGREIRVWKFRTMRVCEDGPQIAQATRNDPRVTPIGAFLRRTSLDELPQLFNVLAGDMSLVGPRPHATAHNEHYRRLIRGYMLRHKVKPGITGLAQVLGYRGETETLEKMQKRVECDHQYIRQWSLWLDVKILLRTVWVVFFSRQNAY